MCTIFSVNDMGKDLMDGYKNLSVGIINEKKSTPSNATKEIVDEYSELGALLWTMDGSDAPYMESVLARELLNRLQRDGSVEGIVSFPEVGTNFTAGKLFNVIGATPFKI